MAIIPRINHLRALFSLRNVLPFVLVMLMVPLSVWGWGNDGHQIVARIAPINLSVNAKKRSAISRRLLHPKRRCKCHGAGCNMADTYLRMHAPKTKPWHFVDICRGSHPGSDLAQFCPNGECITKKIEECRQKLPIKRFKPADAFRG